MFTKAAIWDSHEGIASANLKHKYFDALYNEINNEGGKQALFDLLMSRDISGFDARARPSVATSGNIVAGNANVEQKLHSLQQCPVSAFLHEFLDESEYALNSDGRHLNPITIKCTDFYGRFHNWCLRRGSPNYKKVPASNQFGRLLKK